MGIFRPDTGKLVWALAGLFIGPKVVTWVRSAAGR